MNAKKRLEEAFFKLQGKEDFEMLSVVLLCERAGCHRNSFYYYYEDLLNFIQKTLFKEIKEEVKHLSTFQHWYEGYLVVMEYLNKRGTFFQGLYNSKYWREVDYFIDQLSDPIVRGVIEEEINRRDFRLPKASMNFLVRYYRILLTGHLLFWLKGGLEEDPKEHTLLLRTMLEGNLSVILEKIGHNKLSDH